jgi:hypothetical protein
MKFLSILTLVLCTQNSFAGPLVGYATMEPTNTYQIVNTAGAKIFSATADTVKRVELRDGFAVVQSSTNNVSLIAENGTVLVDAVFGAELSVSHKLISIYNKDGIGAVFTIQGKKLYPAEDESQTRPVQSIYIANDHFAVIDKLTRVLTVYDLAGEVLFSSNDISRVLLSDAFLVTESALGTLTLYDAEMSILTTESAVREVRLSDEFAGLITNNGTLRLYSKEEGEFPLINDVSAFSLTNTFAAVTDAFGLTLYGRDKSTLETPTVRKSFSFSHELFAYVGNTGALWVKNMESEESFVVNRADTYAMSDDLLVVKNGNGDFTVYSLRKDSFGKVVHSVLDQTIAEYQAGNGVVSFRTTLNTGASNNAKVVYFPADDVSAKNVLVDETPVNKVNLSVNREEWNWQ